MGRNSQQPLSSTTHHEYLICDGCVSRELVHAPGIGFDLSSSYGTAAIRYHNGTVLDIGRVDGNSDYKDFMVRLSAPAKYRGPPFKSPLDEMEYRLDQAKRYIRRSWGLPSTEDISTPGDILKQIKYLVFRELYITAHNIVLSLPYMPNFQHEDLLEALDLAGLSELESYRHWGPLRNTNAAWAGMGMGLCEHWQDIERCDEEEPQDEYKIGLALTYTYDELVVEDVMIIDAHRIYQYVRERFPDLSYGTWDLDRSNTTYWDIIGERAFEVSKRVPWPIEEFVLIGEYAEERRFLDSIRRAFGNNVNIRRPEAQPTDQKFKAESIAARGAAEMAKRWQGETPGCKEGDWCKGNRDYIQRSES